MADFYALREEEFRLDDNFSPFNFATYCNFDLVLEKTREKTDTMVSAAIWTRPLIRFVCHLESHVLT